ncbi:Oidioi.mRNA.OKI2018_I69.PAR.g9730.t1.cds [Oikopleura dioica]|uniref:non-specific serine/threonine protein kinase n=1 Tax=Oikopleura dioica TaxID=34765 RepID=A0ABN7RSW2_OIKDI|nr:Oidioi.mRNA.OKI2018_I69.PAR.g9730.t1.cds [Oikopleura dioica]
MSSREEEAEEHSYLEHLDDQLDDTVSDSEEAQACCTQAPKRERRAHQISESKTVRVNEPSVISRVTNNVFAFRDDSREDQRLCKVHYGELDEDFREELSIINRLKHPCLTPIEELRHKPEVGSVIIYKKSSGNLRDFIEQNGPMSEKVASKMFRKIVDTVDYCHQKNVGLGNNIRLYHIVYDDGHSSQIRFDMLDSPIDTSDSPVTSLRNYSVFYCAPELIFDIENDFDIVKADLWSLGILLFKMLTDSYPFHDTDLKKQFTRICHQRLPLPGHLSTSALSVLASLLHKNPEKRATLEDLKNHPWLNSNSEIDEPKSVLF